jgi:hypothetical protein
VGSNPTLSVAKENNAVKAYKSGLCGVSVFGTHTFVPVLSLFISRCSNVDVLATEETTRVVLAIKQTHGIAIGSSAAGTAAGSHRMV